MDASSTYDPQFEKAFRVKHIKDGDQKNFPDKHSYVTVHYTGIFPETKKKFDCSRDRKEPFSFMLGVGNVIKCWDIVVNKMSLGEKLYVECPYKLAYGERGAGRIIPPYTNIGFEIELLEFTRRQDF